MAALSFLTSGPLSSSHIRGSRGSTSRLALRVLALPSSPQLAVLAHPNCGAQTTVGRGAC